MKLNYQAFLRNLFLFTLAIGAVIYGLTFLLPENFITPTLPYLLVFFFASTLLVHYLLLQVAQKRTASFINYFMLLTFGKLIFFLSIVLLYALIFREDAGPFIISFFILYVLFTVFEVSQSLSITRSLNANRKKTEDNKS